ncbi:MAG: hypothetical protein ABOK23_12210 [Candidatus Methanoperedens sp.]|nr:hypothetical protein [Candidatus Methanoperedens sp.]MCZ7395309.1 hypothetical protein [Candidatus Methanoperedens sp.]
MRQTIKKFSCTGLTGAGELTLQLGRLEKNRAPPGRDGRRTGCAAAGCAGQGV